MISTIKDPEVQARMALKITAQVPPPQPARTALWCGHPLDALVNDGPEGKGGVDICSVCSP
jgi:hypothetical protein